MPWTSSFKTDAQDDISGSVVIVSIVPTEILYYIAILQSRTTAHFPGREFLSDKPFFGLSLWTQFKLALCACVSGWSSTLESRSKLGDGSIWSIQV